MGDQAAWDSGLRRLRIVFSPFRYSDSVHEARSGGGYADGNSCNSPTALAATDLSILVSFYRTSSFGAPERAYPRCVMGATVMRWCPTAWLAAVYRRRAGVVQPR